MTLALCGACCQTETKVCRKARMPFSPAAQDRIGSDFLVGLEVPTRKVLIQDMPFEGWFGNCYELALAKNEHEGFQVVVIPVERELRNVEVSVSPLKSADGRHEFRTDQVEVSLVGHLNVRPNPPYDQSYVGWWPDPLLSFMQKCKVIEPHEKVAFWIDVATDVDTPAGDYAGEITVTAEGCDSKSIDLKVHVWDFQLPDGTHLRNVFTYVEPYASSLYGDRWDATMARKYHDFILDHRLNIDRLYGPDPQIDLLLYGFERGMNSFNIPKGMDEIDEIVPRLKELGLYDYAYVYGFDETRNYDGINKVFGRIKAKYPDLETMTTSYDETFGRESGTREAVDIWVPLTDKYSLEEAESLRAEGKDMWWYVCSGPIHPYANVFIEYTAIEARLLMGTMAYKRKVGGFLYWMLNRWVKNVELLTDGPYTYWWADPETGKHSNKHPGDGDLMCAGPEGPLSTIRLENIRDGLEDYEYLVLLAERVDQIKQAPLNPSSRNFVKRAEKALGIPGSVVSSHDRFSFDPWTLYKYREQLAELILEGKKYE